jgi:hypothetical protein
MSSQYKTVNVSDYVFSHFNTESNITDYHLLDAIQTSLVLSVK